MLVWEIFVQDQVLLKHRYQPINGDSKAIVDWELRSVTIFIESPFNISESVLYAKEVLEPVLL